jgi:uncharacterized membrane protein YgdD (TMEM256/DUF423 family)
MKPATTIRLGAAMAAMSVLCGAFAAHGLKHHLDERALAIFHTAAQYQMYHALALIICGLLAEKHPRKSPTLLVASHFFLAGILLFSGSLYLLALTGIGWLGAITPLGGIGFILGWLQLIRQRY